MIPRNCIARKGNAHIVSIVVLAFICVFVLAGVGFVVRVFLYPVAQAEKIYEKTLDADNVVMNYEWFKQQSEDIKATDAKVKMSDDAVKIFLESAGSREKWDFRDKEEHARLTANAVGLRQARADMAATYNARAKMANRKIFMQGVPEKID